MTAAAIGIDVCTSGVRTPLVDAGGVQLGCGFAKVAPGDRRKQAAWWHAVESALAALKSAADLSGVGYRRSLSLVAGWPRCEIFRKLQV